MLLCFYYLANENRYEGSWKEDKKHGDGKFYFLDSGQLYIGTWVNDIPKCGTCEEFGKDTATNPSPYPLPEVRFAYNTMLPSHLVMQKQTTVCFCLLLQSFYPSKSAELQNLRKLAIHHRECFL